MPNQQDGASKGGLETFEQSLKKLEEIVAKLESGKLGLEEGMLEFEKGVTLYKECKDLMNRAEKKISVLSENLKEDEYL